ncbi:oligopeptide ABC transporter permease [Mycoplasmopsis maculosa]|uniref:Oligopeptide ABC transporter permease n=1 Tax=Mycoplasmopsis maculosa TaxID=114885 RepID=A0A449B5G6_9BACT|nr:ABC transporter permease [Mycoplasmopsis maculosa]VEU75816.1 oligopeptide ABC transporter permease [Mycoplasmopsis maculosa]
MSKYLLKRIALAILTLFIILIFSYTLIVSFIENPFTIQLEQAKTPQDKENFRRLAEIYNNTPVFTKIVTYFSNFFKGDFGQTFFIKNDYKTIPGLFFAPLKWSILVSLPSFILSSVLGISLGVFAGYKRGTIWDSIINVFVFIFVAIPSFIIAPLLINLFSQSGFPIRFIAPGENYSSGKATIWTSLYSLIPAIIVVTFGSLAVYTLYTRNQTVTVLTSNYILIAKTKGLNSRQIFFKYVLRNISIPLIALILPSYIGLLSGSIVIEKFWGIPGSSSIIAQAFPAGEINVVMFNIFFFTSLSLFTEIIVDISFTILDPRIVYESNSGIDLLRFIRAAKSRKQQIKELLKQQNEQKTNFARIGE